MTISDTAEQLRHSIYTHLAQTGTLPSHDELAADQIWPDAAHACGNQLIFCSGTCVDTWLDRHGHQRGYVMSLETLWNLAAHWYEGRFETPHIRRDPTAAADYFRSVGLHGPFWGLTV